jgi:tagatose 1,6-diphosphate aldolase/sulfofructosephosphate aldolase
MDTLSLDAIANPDGRLAVLAMDQRATLRRMLDGAGKPSADADLSAFKVDVVRALAPLSTGVLLDADFGVGPVREAGALPDDVGLLVAAEPVVKAKWNDEIRTTVDPERGAGYVLGHGGDALKFLVQWRPNRPAVADEPDLAAEALSATAAVIADCAQAGVPSVIEPLIARLPGEEPFTPDTAGPIVIESATQMAALRPDLLKLEWPGSADGCRQVSEALGDVPWTLLSAGVAIDEFLERVQIALEAGAVGFIAGRAIWGEAVTLEGEERVSFLRKTAVPRLAALCDALTRDGRSWREVAGAAHALSGARAIDGTDSPL